MPARKYNRYSEELKDEAIRLALEEELTRMEICRRLGVKKSSVTLWLKQHQQREEAILAPSKALAPSDRIKRLEEENRRLRMERDVLKKAMAYFARPSR